MFDWLSILFPKKCIFCGRILENGKEEDVCSICGNNINLLEDKSAKSKGAFYDRAAAPFLYEGQVRDSLHRFKFSGRQSYARPFAKLMSLAAWEAFGDEADIIAFVPTNEANIRKRGYDHAKLLAKNMSDIMGLPMLEALKRTRKTAAMYKLGIEERKKNISGSVALRCRPEEISGKNIILADDILTTGATASECARVLKEGGAGKVLVCTVAKNIKY